MLFKTLLTTAVLALAPALSWAQCSGGHTDQAMSCAEGTHYDAETNTCQVMTG